MRPREILIGLVALGVMAVLALVIAPRLIDSTEVPMPTQIPTLTPAYWPTEGWRTSTPEEQGFDSMILARELQKLRDARAPIDSLLIIRQGSVVLDAYFQPYDGTFLHNLASVTKSFTTTLTGIAAGQGKIQLERPMVEFFPNRSIDNLDARKKSMTVLHLAGMMNGLESGCLQGDEPTLTAMRSNADWVRAALNRKMARDPGLAFCYDSPGMHILSALIQETTGMTELEFGRTYLFEPLGIHDVIWPADPQGYTHGWGDLHLKPLDAAKLGYLWLQGGVWEGRQIVPAKWVKDAVSFHNHAGQDDYGYGWWLPQDGYYAAGRGGQYIRVYPQHEAIVVVTAAGLDYMQAEPLLEAAYLSPDQPLPPNPEGVKKLNEVVAALGKAPAATVSSSLPQIAAAVSGQTYDFGANAAEKLNLDSLQFEFSGTRQATLEIKQPFGQTTWLIGLDGRYRQSPDGQTTRGYWSDPQTFVIEVFDIGQMTYRMHFDGNRVVLSSPNFIGEYEGVAKAQ